MNKAEGDNAVQTGGYTHEGISGYLYPPQNGATFKWSRDNGSIVTRLTDISGKILTVTSNRRDRLLGFAAGHTVEITDDRRQLWGKQGTLVKLTDVNGNEFTFDESTVKGDALTEDNFPKEFNPKVRRWDSISSIKVKIPDDNEGYLPLEDGIEIKFSNGSTYKTGDYWLIPARTIKGDVEWPRTGDTADALPPEGIEHHYCRLAILQFEKNFDASLIADCRQRFPSLTDLITPSPPLPPQLPPQGTKSTSWVHGTVVEVQHPQRLEPHPEAGQSGFRQGKGTLYQQITGDNWFHFPIPTPNIPGDIKPLLERFYVLYKTKLAIITKVQIWDGPIFLKAFENLSLTGDHSSEIDSSNSWIIEQPIAIRFGVGISINVNFKGVETNGEAVPDDILFTTAGVDFKMLGDALKLPLYRYYRVANGDHFYTMDISEGDRAVQTGGYTAEGIAGYLYSSVPSGTLPLYRYYNSANGDHFYTMNKAEGDNAVQTGGYTHEGIAGYLYPPVPQQAPTPAGTLPLYRYYNAANGDHFYTMNKAEGDNAVQTGGYTHEGISGYLYPSTSIP
jgi:hypothetical protein